MTLQHSHKISINHEKSTWEKFAIKTGKQLEPPDMSSTTEMNCIYEGELIQNTVSSFQSFNFSFCFPACLSQVQDAQMAYQKGSDMKEISSPGQAEKQLMENQSVLLWSVKKWLVKYWCGIHKEKKKKRSWKI